MRQIIERKKTFRFSKLKNFLVKYKTEKLKGLPNLIGLIEFLFEIIFIIRLLIKSST